MRAGEKNREKGKPRERKAYERPALRVVQLTLEETLAEGCKIAPDPLCLGSNFLPGS